MVLLVEVVMVSLPTSDMSGDRIKAFYEAHRQIIIAQQIIGALALVPFLAFVIALDRRARAAGARWVQWLIPAGVLLAACEVAAPSSRRQGRTQAGVAQTAAAPSRAGSHLHGGG